MKYVNGDLLDTALTCIAHGCNTQNGFSSGVAGAIKIRWPEVKKAYHEYVGIHGKGAHLLGRIQKVDVAEHIVFNCFTQDRYGYDRAKYASPEAIVTSLSKVAIFCVETGIRDIAIPEIGCGLGGLRWGDLEPMLVAIEQDHGIEFTVYRYVE